jgi:hypothetical protein
VAVPGDPVKDFLDRLNTSNRVRAAAWEAAYDAADSDDFERRFANLPLSPEMKGQLWEIRFGQGAELPEQQTTATAEQFTDQADVQPAPEGSAAGRFAGSLWDQVNPITMAKGVYQAVRHPLDTASALGDAQMAQFGKARDAYQQGHMGEAFGYAGAGLIPILGPAAAAAGEQIASGDVAGGFGSATGMLAPSAGTVAARGARRAISPAGRDALATRLEAGASERVVDVMSPKVGPNKTRFGNRAEGVAGPLLKDGTAKAWTRDGFHENVSARLADAERGLDAAHDQRLAARTFDTKPMIDALLEQRRRFTAQSVEGSSVPRGTRQRTSAIVDERGKPIEVTDSVRKPIGSDVVPEPNNPRVAVIDRAIAELRQLGPVARYDDIRTIRQAYDGPAKVVYNPSLTQDFLKAQGGKFGAADVTGVLREQLAKWDPETAAANADYHLYKTAEDVLEATRETERARPRVGRQIMTRLTTTMAGGQAGGPVGAATGFILGPVVDGALSSGLTIKLQVADRMARLARAIRAGNVEQVNRWTTELQGLKRLAPSSAVATDRAASQAAARSAEGQRAPEEQTALR